MDSPYYLFDLAHWREGQLKHGEMSGTVREGKMTTLVPPPKLTYPVHPPPDGGGQEERAAAAGPGGQAAAEGQGLQAPGRGSSEFMVFSTLSTHLPCVRTNECPPQHGAWTKGLLFTLTLKHLLHVSRVLRVVSGLLI